MQCTKCGAQLQPGATVCPACEERVVPTKSSVAEPRKRAAAPVSAAPASTFLSQPAEAAVTENPARTATGRKGWPMPVLAAIVVVVVAITGWVVYSIIGGGGGANTPEAAATHMMNAYAVYDAKTVLANVTHASLNANDEAAFAKQMADMKTAAKDKPSLTGIKVTNVTIDPANPDSAIVKLTEKILDPVAGTYSTREETLSVVKRDGRWLVVLF